MTGRNLFDVLATWYGKSNRKITNTQFNGVPVRIYEPPKIESGELLPAVVYTHGGGFRCLSVGKFLTSRLIYPSDI